MQTPGPMLEATKRVTVDFNGEKLVKESTGSPKIIAKSQPAASNGGKYHTIQDVMQVDAPDNLHFDEKFFIWLAFLLFVPSALYAGVKVITQYFSAATANQRAAALASSVILDTPATEVPRFGGEGPELETPHAFNYNKTKSWSHETIQDEAGYSLQV